MQTSSITKRLRHLVLSKILGENDPAFMFLLDESWTPGLIREHLRARRYVRKIRPENVRRVFFFSYSRSGTHNALSRFHYLPTCFVLKENVFRSAADPYQTRLTPDGIHPRFVLCRSMFGENGLQNKDGADLDRLFLWNNYYLEDSEPLSLDALRDTDSVVFYVRNFLRVLCSRDKAGRKKGKRHWIMTDELFSDTVQRHRRKLSELLRLADTFANRVHVCFHERFCSKPEVVMNELCDGIGIPSERRVGWDDPRSFFTRSFGGGAKPLEKEGRLWCPRRGKFILGTGGEFNPLPPVSFARTMSDRIDEWLTPSRRTVAESAFGRGLVEWWVGDAEFPYATTSNGELLARLRRRTEGH